jgi:hypothetical protein
MRRTYSLLFVLLGLSSALFAQSNDCATAQTLTVGTSCSYTAGSTSGFTQSNAAISCNGFTGNADDDGWFKFVATNAEQRIDVVGAANFDAVIDVRTGACPGSSILCSDYSTGGGSEFVTYSGFVVGQTYYIRLYDYASGSGNFNICVTGPSCSDGIRDGNETDVDCGGSCGACAGYMMPTAGIAGEYVGACMVNTCSGTFYDSGGPSGNTSNNANFSLTYPYGYYRVFCPTAAGKCVRVTFTSFSLTDISAFCFNYYGTGTNCCDELWITNSSTQNGTLLWGGCGTSLPPVITSTDASGCLSFRYNNDNTVTDAGWAAILSCVTCAGGPNSTDNNDCSRSVQICNTTAFNSNASGPGFTSEACGGLACFAGGENHANWYYFQIATSGTLLLQITPQNGTDDYDFAIFGPNVICGALGTPIRCSDSYLGGTTGLNATSVDVSENVEGDKFCAQMNVVAGQVYRLLIDEWTNTGLGYTISFTGSTATISCTPLPVEFLSFDAKFNEEKKGVDLKWATASETNNSHFDLEKSIDGENYYKIDMVLGAGNSDHENTYSDFDPRPFYKDVNYYRLKQVDYDGDYHYSDAVAVMIQHPDNYFAITPNPINNLSKIHFNSAFADVWTLNIYNDVGNVVFTETLSGLAGPNELPVPFTSLAQGVYLIKMKDFNQAYEGKFFIY